MILSSAADYRSSAETAGGGMLVSRIFAGSLSQKDVILSHQSQLKKGA
jgi:hypothetical protein